MDSSSRRGPPLVAALLSFLTACASATSWESEASELEPAASGLASTARPEAFDRRSLMGREENYFGPSDVAPPSAAEHEEATAPADRKMIYTAQMAVEVARPEEAIAAFRARVEAWGGYLSGRRDHSVTCRVPAERFEAALQELREAGRVLSESMQANDVTKQHLDLGIRLENARKARDRLLALLAKAEKVEDILKIEEQLRRLTEEIERMEGELKYLDDQVAYSTITATFQAVAPPTGEPRRRSRFHWINMVGAENVRSRF